MRAFSRLCLLGLCVLSAVFLGELSPANAQEAVNLTPNDCMAEKNTLRRANIPEDEISRLMAPLGLQNGLDPTLAEQNRQRILYGRRVAILPRQAVQVARYDLALCAINTALSRRVAPTAPRTAPPAVVRAPQQVIQRGNDSSCVQLRSSQMWNACNFTVEVSFCVTQPQQTKNFFDNSAAFTCPRGGLSGIGAGRSEPNILHGHVHWFACDIKYRGKGGRVSWNPQRQEYDGYCETVKQ